MAETVHDVGDHQRISVLFTADTPPEPADPSIVTFRLLRPDGTVTTLVYTDGNNGLKRADTGSYYYDLEFGQHGRYRWRWEADGAVLAAADGRARVRRSHVLNL